MGRTPDPKAREALLEAARVEFAKRGLDHARVEDIAKRAGLSKGAFYLHFKTKEEAFSILAQRLVGALEEVFRKHAEEEHEFEQKWGRVTAQDVACRSDRFAAMRECHCDFQLELLELLWRNREVMAVIDSVSSNTWRAQIKLARDRMALHLVGDFSLMKQRGELREGLLPDAVTDMVMGAFEAFLRRMVDMKTKPDLEAWSHTVYTILKEGMYPAAAGAAPGRRRRSG